VHGAGEEQQRRDEEKDDPAAAWRARQAATAELAACRWLRQRRPAAPARQWESWCHLLCASSVSPLSVFLSLMVLCGRTAMTSSPPAQARPAVAAAQAIVFIIQTDLYYV